MVENLGSSDRKSITQALHDLEYDEDADHCIFGFDAKSCLAVRATSEDSEQVCTVNGTVAFPYSLLPLAHDLDGFLQYSASDSTDVQIKISASSFPVPGFPLPEVMVTVVIGLPVSILGNALYERIKNHLADARTPNPPLSRNDALETLSTELQRRFPGPLPGSSDLADLIREESFDANQWTFVFSTEQHRYEAHVTESLTGRVALIRRWRT